MKIKIEVSKYTIILLCLGFMLSHCSKQKADKHLNPYYKADINDKTKNVYACGSSGYVAEYLKDTAIFIGFGCGGERAGFYIKGEVKDGTYALGLSNTAFYGLEPANYVTDSTHNGTITIETNQHQNAIGNTILYIKGTFSFKAIDTTTGHTVSVENGEYLLEKRHY